MYHKNSKVLPWIGGPEEGIWTNEHWEHIKDQISWASSHDLKKTKKENQNVYYHMVVILVYYYKIVDILGKKNW